LNKYFPVYEWQGIIPVGNHPGSFGAKRKHDNHTGVDLYVHDNEMVIAVESGVVVNVEDFTGPAAGYPWWNATKSILIEGESGVICYGELLPLGIEIGDMILAGQTIGFVEAVLPVEKIRKDIPGHSNFMLHFELYIHGIRESTLWHLDKNKPGQLLDPTNLLTSLYNAAIV
jgi:murein DD-endopeptidase MepM/ murein hydrolase activator NlpD